MEGTRVLLHLQSQCKQTTCAVASNWRAAYASNQRAPPRSHATRIPGLEQLTSAGDYLGWSRPSCQRRRKRRPESRTSLKNFRRRTLDAFGAREPKDQRTSDYVVKRTSEGKGKKEIMRCLKRYITREIYRVLQNPRLGLLTNDLRPRCLALHFTQTAVALELSAWPKAISRIERGATQDRVLSERYRTWLSEQPKISA